MMTINWVLHVSLALCISSLRITNIPTPKDAEFAAETGKHNLCIDGHFAPEFYLIGAQRASTTTLSHMLSHPDMIRPVPLEGEPAFYIKELHTFSNEKIFQKGKAHWLQHFPGCTTDKRKVALDETPAYLRTSKAPQRMKEMYGKDADRLKFAAILRSPMDRILSAFHFYQKRSAKGHLQEKCVTQLHEQPTLEAYLKNVVQHEQDDCDFLNGTDYGTQLKRYFEEFSPSQFMIIPFKQVVAPKDGKSNVVPAIWKFLGLSGQHGSPEIVHKNHGQHNTLDQEIKPETKAAFAKYLLDHRLVDPRGIAELLIEKGITLFGYQGPSKDVDELTKYLQNSW